MPGGKRIIVILPVYNEQGKISKVIRKVQVQIAAGIVDECLVVDDGSDDGTADEVRAAGASLLSKGNEGVGSAIRAGLDYAVEKAYDIAVVMAGDDQDVPAEILGVIEPLLSKDYDFVQGSRRLGGRRTVNMPPFRRITTKIYSFIFRLLTGFKCTDGTNGFRAFRLDMLKDPKINLRQRWLNTYELEPYLFYKAVTGKYKVCEAPVTKLYHKQILGYTKMVPVLDWWNILRPLILLRAGLKK